eukprot:TRINITY_DN271_c0_g1_i1.p1 TRINITY_DN271_c0_g1~~TRINITY_DN271_c0_g1_i1.p1  ORF type:complete len:202 (+),score=57.76 TRINITY_DN271_c0_g1_i1:57-662(+)
MEPHDVFDKISKDRYLLQIAYTKNIELSDRQVNDREAIINALAADCETVGVSKVLTCLKVSILKTLTDGLDFTPIPSSKSGLVKLLTEVINTAGVSKYLTNLSTEQLMEICAFIDDLDEDDDNYTKQELSAAFEGYVNEFGLLAYLDGFSTADLRKFVKSTGVRDVPTSKSDLMEELMSESTNKRKRTGASGSSRKRRKKN